MTNEVSKNNTLSKGNFITAFFASFNAIDYVKKNSGFGKFFILPFLINIAVLSLIFYFSYSNIYPFFDDLLKGDGTIINAIKFILKPLLMILILIVISLIYSILGSIITSPFNDIISEKVEKIEGVSFEESGFSLMGVIDDIVRTIKNIIKLLFLMILVNIILLFLYLIPVAGPVLHSTLSFLVTAFFFGFQFFDFPLERRKYSFSKKLKVTLKYKTLVIGVGTAFFVMSFIPLIGFLSLNLAAVAGTRMYIDYIKPNLTDG